MQFAGYDLEEVAEEIEEEKLAVPTAFSQSSHNSWTPLLFLPHTRLERANDKIDYAQKKEWFEKTLENNIKYIREFNNYEHINKSIFQDKFKEIINKRPHSDHMILINFDDEKYGVNYDVRRI